MLQVISIYYYLAVHKIKIYIGVFHGTYLYTRTQLKKQESKIIFLVNKTKRWRESNIQDLFSHTLHNNPCSRVKKINLSFLTKIIVFRQDKINPINYNNKYIVIYGVGYVLSVDGILVKEALVVLANLSLPTTSDKILT